jgi:hypothetical protein
MTDFLIRIFVVALLFATPVIFADPGGQEPAQGEAEEEPRDPEKPQEEPQIEPEKEPQDPDSPQEPGEPSEAGEPSFEERLDALLAETLSPEEYRETTNCLYRAKYRYIDVISEDYILFSRRNEFWLNKLKRKCRGVNNRLVITTVNKGVNSACRGDLVYASTRFDLDLGFTHGGTPVSPRAICVLGEFEQIGEQQAEALKGLR